MKKTNILQAAKLQHLEEGNHHDGGGLYLRKRGQSFLWMLRFTSPETKKRAWHSLGSYPDMSLKDARTAATNKRLVLAGGQDIAVVKRAQKAETARQGVTFEELVMDYFETHREDWSVKNREGGWLSEMRNHVFPKIGGRLAREVDRDAIVEILEPIWNTKHPTAEKALTKTGQVLEYGEAKKLGTFRREAQLARKLLGATEHFERQHPSLAHWEVPAFYASLSDDVTHLGLRFLMLTMGVRAGNVRLARWSQIDGDTWLVPRVAMKSKRKKARGRSSPHVVPLNDQAQEILDMAAKHKRDDSDLIFPRVSQVKKGGIYPVIPISDGTWAKFMEDNCWLEERNPDETELDLDIRAAVPHGFRHTFSNWANSVKRHDKFVVETLLDHAVRGGDMGTYWTSEIADQVRPVIEDWCQFVTNGAPVANVTRLPSKAS